MKRRPEMFALLLLVSLPLSGCYKDKGQSYKMDSGASDRVIAATNAAKVADKPASGEKPKTADPVPTEADLGIPFYPGAAPVQEEGALRSLKQADGLIMVTLETAEKLDSVDTYYKAKMPTADRVAENTDGKRNVMFMQAGANSRLLSVEIKEKNDKTQIELSNVHAPQRPTSSPVSPGTTVPLPAPDPPALPGTSPATGSIPPPPGTVR